MGKNICNETEKFTETNRTLIAEELLAARIYIIQNEQNHSNKEEFLSLTNGISLEKNSPLFNFELFIEEIEIIRLGGSLQFGDLSINEKHPFILLGYFWI